MIFTPIFSLIKLASIARAIAAPTISSLSVNSGPEDGGTLTTISGSGFVDGTKFTKISTGYAGYYSGNPAATTCGITTTGKAYCWGGNQFGQLGNGSTSSFPSSSPVAVSTSGVLSGKILIDISVGGATVCAVDDAGVAYCWGSNATGQLGIGTTTDSSSPVAVSTAGVLSGKTVTSIATSATSSFTSSGIGGSTCAVASGAAYCWGNNATGQLGDASTTQRTSPVAVSTSGVLSGKTVTQVSTKTAVNGSTKRGFSCAVASGAAYCWGNNDQGQLGDASTTQRTSPVAVSTSGVLSGKTIAGISVSGTTAGAPTHTGTACAIDNIGAAYCWGYNTTGQFGSGNTTNSNTPVATKMSSLTRVLPTVTFGSTAVTMMQVVSSTQLQVYTPIHTPGIVSVTITNFDGQQATLTNAFTYAPLTTPSVSNVSPNSGPTAGGTAITVSGSNFVNTTSNVFSSISMGGSINCGLATSGSIYCWGYDYYGSAGSNSKSTYLQTPEPVNTNDALDGKTVTQVSAGGGVTCAVASGAAYCWGTDGSIYGNNLGVSGGISKPVIPMPVDTSGVLGGKTVTQVSAGGGVTCAVASGAAYCWGNLPGVQSSLGSDLPVAVDTSGVLGGKTVTQISAGSASSCAVASGNAYCWGSGSDGQLGDGNSSLSYIPVAVSTSGVLGGKTVTQVTTSSSSSCAVASGAAYCWGKNDQGQLGDGTTTTRPSPVAVTAAGVLGGKTITKIVTDGNTTCAVASGAAYCWGKNDQGQLGDGTTTGSSSPVAVTAGGVLSGKTLTDIGTAGGTTCAVDTTGVKYCWGGNTAYNFGNNNTTASSTPVTTPALPTLSLNIGGTEVNPTYISSTQLRAITPAHSTGAVDVSVTNANSKSDTLASAFTYIAPYAGPTLSSVTPNSGNISGGTSVTLSGTNIAETASFTQISSTAASQGGSTDNQHSCGVTADGRAYCWGVNTYGQLGNGTTTASSTPVPVTGLLSSKIAVQVATGGDTSCALTADNLIYCWGKNGSAQFGNGTWSDSSTPVATTMSGALNGKTITQITVGGDWACALASDGSAYCWGNNWNGRLGTGGTTDSSTPAAVTGGLSFISINAMASNTCGITTTYKTYCWGSNDTGQVGDNTTTQRTSPTPVSTSGVLSGVNLIQVYPLNSAACALSSVGNVYCWGGGWAGQLGNGGNSQSLVPVAVTMSGRTAVSIGGGRTQVCMVTTTSNVYCWGDNTYGQLGDGTTTGRNVPTQMNTASLLSGKTIIQVSTGNYDTCVLTLDQITACVGYNASGELGNNSVTNSSSLVLTQNYALPYILTFGGTNATNIAHVNQNTITATTPSHAAGTVAVALTRSDGKTANLTNGYTYIGAPGAPTSLTTTPASNGVTLNWITPANNGGSPITDYLVEYSSNGGSTWSTFSHTASTTPAQTVTGLSAGTTYTFRVSAVNAVGAGTPSTTVTGTPLFITVSSLPSVNLAVTPDSSGRISSQSSSATVSTNNSAGYILQLSTTSTDRNLTRSGGSDTITPSSGSSSSPASLAANTWGFRVDSLGAFGSGTFLETNLTTSSFTWAGVPALASPTTIRTTAATASNDATTVWYAMRAASNKPSGNYINTILYTAVVN